VSAPSQLPLSTPSLEDHEKAFTEVSFLLQIYAATVDDLMGGATASVGRIAGRHLARKLPVYLPEPKLSDVLSSLAEQLKAGFEFSHELRNGGASVTYERCAMREVCMTRGVPAGGEICRLYHFVFDGMVSELLCRPAKTSISRVGERCCETDLEIR
jgi:hypothetical protein